MSRSFLSPGANTGGDFGDFLSEEGDVKSTCVGSYQGTPLSLDSGVSDRQLGIRGGGMTYRSSNDRLHHRADIQGRRRGSGWKPDRTYIISYPLVVSFVVSFVVRG